MNRTRNAKFDKEDSEIEIECGECKCIMSVHNDTATCGECGNSFDLYDESDFDFREEATSYEKNAEFGGMEW